MKPEAGFADLEAALRGSPITAAVVYSGGREMFSIGDTSSPVEVHSIRKSLISALFGRAYDRGIFQLDTMIEAIGIDDTPPLTEREKRATIEDLLTARSGVYLPPAARIDGFEWPPRESHAPGTHWHYNNWDFNVLGNIYERLTHRSVGVAFDREIALPLGLRDWDIYEHARYEYRDDPIGGNLRYPNYAFALSARDLASFGALYLDHGGPNGVQLISREWLDRSTGPIARTTFPPGLFGMYGYCWWVNGPHNDGGSGIGGHVYSAVGFAGNYLTVLPELGTVVAVTADPSRSSNTDGELLTDRRYEQAISALVSTLREPARAMP
ncbi:serine hydrolase domain-containing protein [Nocardia vaccinii]|uniref:serine hydrolase domain-containing protein n=1 Tax=Nocardia vaccinii TaxID=1822 RepID=UPI00082FA2F3|nr:serine hydrolase [Nocardia vaccinii]